MDIDELIGNDLRSGGSYFRPSRNAVKLLDDISDRSGGVESLKFKWFYTILNSSLEFSKFSRSLSDSRKYQVFGSRQRLGYFG